MKAWIVSWDWAGEHATARIDPDQVWILNSRLTQRQVLPIVEALYLDRFFSLEEKLAYAKRGNWHRFMSDNLYHSGYIEGIPYLGEFYFGHNPMLHARFAENVRVEATEGLPPRLAYDPVGPRLRNPKPLAVP